MKLTSEPDSIDTGILFVHATWSGPSVMALRLLTEFVSTLPDPPDFFVADIDALSDEDRRRLGAFKGWGLLHGAGETFWIVDRTHRDAFHEYAAKDAMAQLARIHRTVFPIR